MTTSWNEFTANIALMTRCSTNESGRCDSTQLNTHQLNPRRRDGTGLVLHLGRYNIDPLWNLMEPHRTEPLLETSEPFTTELLYTELRIPYEQATSAIQASGENNIKHKILIEHKEKEKLILALCVPEVTIPGISGLQGKGWQQKMVVWYSVVPVYSSFAHLPSEQTPFSSTRGNCASQS